MTMHARPHAPPHLSPPSPNTSYRCQACRCEANAASVNADAPSALLRRHGAGRRRVRQGRDLQPVSGAEHGPEHAPHELGADSEPKHAGADRGDVGPNCDPASEPRAVNASAEPAAHRGPDADADWGRLSGRVWAARRQVLQAYGHERHDLDRVQGDVHQPQRDHAVCSRSGPV